MPSLQNNHNCKLPEVFLYWSKDHETTLAVQFPVHKACRDNAIDTLNHLLSTATSVNNELLGVQDPYLGWTPAHWAAFFGHLECVQRLPPAGLELRSASGETLLHVAALGARPNLLYWLLQYGTPSHLTDDKGETALHKAARSKSYECTRLLAVCGADYSARNKEGLTASQIAEQEGGMLENIHNPETLECKQSPSYHISSNTYYGYHTLPSNTTEQKNGSSNGHQMTANETNNGITNTHDDVAMDADDGQVEHQMENQNGHINGCHVTMQTNGFADMNGARKRCMQDNAQHLPINVEAKRMRREDFTPVPDIPITPREVPQPPAVPSTSVLSPSRVNKLQQVSGIRHVKFYDEAIIIGESSPVEINNCQNNVQSCNESKDGATVWRCRTPLEDVGNYTNDLLRGTHGCDFYSYMRHDEL